jgi:hypothetical protein
MATTSQVSNIVIEPVDLAWGNQHLVCFDTVAGTGLGGDHFLVSSNTVGYYVWYNTGASSDPAPSGKTELAEVAILVGDTAIQIATKTAAAINALVGADFHAVAVSGEGKIKIELKALGVVESAWTAGTTGFTATILKTGSKLDIGYIDGNVELTLGQQLFDIISHQAGTEVLGKLVTGTELGPLTITMKETVAAKLKELMEVAGVAYTPSGGTEVTAIGALAGSKQFSNVFPYCRSLVMHPTKNAAANLDNDFMFWVAYPNLSNLVISGEEDRKLEVEFSFFLDEQKVNEASKMVYGDWSQNYLKA